MILTPVYFKFDPPKMIIVERNIRELLFEHECVIIPGLGGIISKYRPAQINVPAKRIEPPSRSLSFNRNLANNDGLLIDHISRNEDISYVSAKAIVEEFVNRCRERLESGKGVIMEEIGRIHQNPDGNLIFAPDNGSNFLPSSFGLRAVAAKSLDTEPVTRRNYPPRVDRRPEPSRQPAPASVKWTMALAVPVILFLLWGIIQPGSVHKIYTQSAGYVSDLSFLINGPANHDIASDFASRETISTTSVKLMPKPMKSIRPPAMAFFKLKPVAAKPYHIIGGSFVKMDQALLFAARLRSEGLEPMIIGGEAEGRIRVSYYSFPDKTTALEKLPEVRRQRNASAWLLRS